MLTPSPPRTSSRIYFCRDGGSILQANGKTEKHNNELVQTQACSARAHNSRLPSKTNNATLCTIDPVVAFQTERLLEKRAGAICRIVRSHVMKMVGFAQHHLKQDAVPLPNCQNHKSSANLPFPVLRPPIVSPTTDFSTRLLLGLEVGRGRFSLPKTSLILRYYVSFTLRLRTLQDDHATPSVTKCLCWFHGVGPVDLWVPFSGPPSAGSPSKATGVSQYDPREAQSGRHPCEPHFLRVQPLPRLRAPSLWELHRCRRTQEFCNVSRFLDTI